MASIPERQEVLSRLGILKPGAEDLFGRPVHSRPQQEAVALGDTVESFPTENPSSPLVGTILNVVQSRTTLLLLITVVAVAAVGALVQYVSWPFGTTNAATMSVGTTDAPRAVAETAPAQRAAVKKSAQSRSASIDLSARRERITTNQYEDTSPPAVQSQEERADTRNPLAPEIAAVAPPLATAEVENVIVDQTIYSKDDADVRPPRLLSDEQLPAPAIDGWETRTNVIEVIVSEAGAVERVRFVATPQRMPDMFVLSRAKVWRFSPAMKGDGPVRYRLLLSWEVNP